MQKLSYWKRRYLARVFAEELELRGLIQPAAQVAVAELLLGIFAEAGQLVTDLGSHVPFCDSEEFSEDDAEQEAEQQRQEETEAVLAEWDRQARLKSGKVA